MYSLHDGHGVFQTATILSSLGYTHGSFQKNFNGTFRHVIVTIEFLANFFFKFGNYVTGIGVEEIDETLEHVQVESRGYQFTMSTPFLTCSGIIILIRIQAFPRPIIVVLYNYLRY